MPYLYPLTDGYHNGTSAWDFKWQPHVVVINLGANDHNTSTAAEVTAATIPFLKDVRKKNPNAYIIFAYGMTGNNHESAIRSAISSVGDGKISFLPLKKAEIRVIGHPDQTSHNENAAILEKEIRRVTGWKN